MSVSFIVDYIEKEVLREKIFLDIKSQKLYGKGALPFLRLKRQELWWTLARLKKQLKPEKDISLKSLFFTLLSGADLVPADKGTARNLLIDVTDTLRCRHPTGIQRVVKQLAQAAYASEIGIPVFVQNNKLYSLFSDSTEATEIQIDPRHTLLSGDRSWDYRESYKIVMQDVSANGGKNAIILHDIIALKFPALFPEELYPDTHELFRTWVDDIVLKSDAVVAVSRSAALDLDSYVHDTDKQFKIGFCLGWSHLGAHQKTGSDRSPTPSVKKITQEKTPFFMSVGTIEIRKGISLVLDCFEELWAQGHDIRYVICGRREWGAESIEKRIKSHPEHGKRLIWLSNASNEDINQLYGTARALIFASLTEGFGLPLIEAAYNGLEAIVSDIPVFREIGENNVTYFRAADSNDLTQKISQILQKPKARSGLLTRDWDEAMHSMLDIVVSGDYQLINPRDTLDIAPIDPMSHHGES